MNKIKQAIKNVLAYYGYFHGLYVNKIYLKRFLPSNPVIIDAGASHGSDSIEMSSLWPQGRIYALEPISFVFNMLVANAKGHGNIVCYKYALSDKTGEADIHVSGTETENVGSSSLLEPKLHLTEHPEVAFTKKETIQTITLDDWAKKFNEPKIDMLWLDMQGYELLALKGGLKLLKSVKVIYTEVNLIELYYGAVLYNELRSWLEGQGFQVKKEYINWKDAGNVLFVRP